MVIVNYRVKLEDMCRAFSKYSIRLCDNYINAKVKRHIQVDRKIIITAVESEWMMPSFGLVPYISFCIMAVQ